MPDINRTEYSCPKEQQLLRVKQMEILASYAGYSNPHRVAVNAEILQNHQEAKSPESFHFEPTRHNEGYRYALWTLNTYKLSTIDGLGFYGPTEATRKDWEIHPQERKIATFALSHWKDTSSPRRLPRVNDDLVSMYTNEIRKVPLLSAEEEVELSKQIEAGLYACHKLEGGQANRGRRLTLNEKRDYIDLALEGKDAFDRFYRANLPLVVSVAKRYSGMSMPLIDIIQEGNLGLWHAIEKFDYKKGFKFSTYATKWINQAITNSLPRQTSGLSLSKHVAGSLKKLKHAWSDYEFEYGRQPSIDTLVKKSGLSKYVVEMLFVHIYEPLSIYGTTGGEGQSEKDGKNEVDVEKSLINFIAANEKSIPETFVEDRDIHSRIWRAIDLLDDTEKKVIIGRFGLDDGALLSLEQVGEILGLRTRNAASKRLQGILEGMRVLSQSEGLLCYEDL